MQRSCALVSQICWKRWAFGSLRRMHETPRLLVKGNTEKAASDPEALRYIRQEPVEHVLYRPDTYIGSVIPAEKELWLFSPETRRMGLEKCTFAPGLLKIFDEILVNAADNKQRDPGMSELRVIVDRERNRISVWNNGCSLPISIHPKEKIYIPTLIFGNLFTSSNYDDSEVKRVGGRNGYGAKLCNIYSSEFEVETASRQQGLHFKQTWSHNMSFCSEPLICSGSFEDFTMVSFSPDLSRFGLSELTEDVVRVLERRTIDMAGTLSGVRVFFNGEQIQVNGFEDYVSLFAQDVFFQNYSPRWKIAVTRSNGTFQQMSFVNNIHTPKGGKHVDYVSEKIVSALQTMVEEKLGGRRHVRSSFVKNSIFLCVNSVVENPSFDSQTKVSLCTPASKFGSSFDLDQVAFREWAESSRLVDAIVQVVLNKRVTTRSSSRPIQVIPKLEDANMAGSSSSQKCTLIVTEGDSAKAFAVAGLEKVDRDFYGVFPIRGKLINVSDTERSKLSENAEISNLMKILGIEFNVDYSNPNEFSRLRYGSLMILADQDEDGSHIKGLILNFICRFWPQLVEKGFVCSFKTPLIKAKRKSETISFFNSNEFKKWAEEREDSGEFTVKYYKGLGTSTSDEAKAYFSNLENHVITYKMDSEDDLDSLKKVFDKNRSNDRKRWIEEKPVFCEETTSAGVSTLTQFVNSEMKSYSLLDLKRSIPSVVDGLKPSQRKILHSLLQRKDKKEVKVNQLASAVSMAQAYHHGEESLVDTIVRMAQNFPGSNNLSLLQPIGQFGTRHLGGADAARGRYIFTQLSSVARALFPKADDALLELITEEGMKVEPIWYCPVIPLILVNGTHGIGTGWKTNVHPHNPIEIIDNVRRLIDENEVEDMVPFWNGFQGTTRKVGEGRFVLNGLSNVISTGKDITRISIDELPPEMWTNRYKEKVLVPMMKEGLISDIHENHSERNVHFEVTLKKGLQNAIRSDESRAKALKLTSSVSTTSMVLFDRQGCLRKYKCTGDILLDHFSVRKEVYQWRLARLADSLEAQRLFSENQLRFVIAVSDGSIGLQGSREEIEQRFVERGFKKNPMAEAKGQPSDWSYLLEIPVLRFTKEERSRLEGKVASLENRVTEVKNTSWKEEWTKDLDGLQKEIRE